MPTAGSDSRGPVPNTRWTELRGGTEGEGQRGRDRGGAEEARQVDGEQVADDFGASFAFGVRMNPKS